MIRTSKRYSVGWILALALLSAIPVWASKAEDRGRELLLASLRAGREVSYTAEEQAEVFVRGERTLLRAKVFHQAPDKTRTEYLAPDHMAGTVMVVKGRSAYRYSRRHHGWYPTRWGLADDSPEMVKLLLKNYSVRVQGEETVDGRKADVVQVSPKRPGNPSKTLWVDRASGLVLRSVLRNYRREIISTVKMTGVDIKTSGIDPDLFEVKMAGGRHGEHEEDHDNRPAPGKVILPGYLPAGYVQTGISGIEMRDFRAVHLKFSDGLNTISLFERNGKSHGRPSEGGRERFSRALRWTAGGWEFTLIADLSPEELQRIAASMNPRD